ncbi:hypothetical protein N9F34_05470 [Alphaproteobacteria bacterium]|nr:hypothetical protein [Alphaproteobacteria bacterium]
MGLIGLAARDCDGVKPGIFGIGFGPIELLTNGLNVLGSKQHAHDLASIRVMLKNLFIDKLSFTVAIGG